MILKSSERDWLDKKCVRIWKKGIHEHDKFLGTGFFLTPIHIVTAAHVVAEHPVETLYITGRAWSSARFVEGKPEYSEFIGPRKKKRDVAVLSISKSGAANIQPIGLAGNAFLKESWNKQVTIGGFAKPEGEDLKTLRVNLENYNSASDAIATSSPVEPGMSGGPAVRDGCLLGILYASSDEKHKSYLIPLASIRTFLDRFITQEPILSYDRYQKLTLGKARKWACYVDRESQLDDLIRFIRLGQSDFGSAPLPRKGLRLVATILPCSPKDLHRHLRQRFAAGEHKFNPGSEYARILTGMPIYDVEIPSKEPKNIELELHRMKERLRSALSARSVKPEDIRDALNKRQSLQGVFSTLIFESGNIGPKREALINVWLKYWEAVGGGDEQESASLEFPVVIIFAVITDIGDEKASERKLSLFNLLRRRRKSTKKWAKEWPHRSSDIVFFDAFESLGLIKQSHIEAWLKILKGLNSELCEAIDESLPQVAMLVPVRGQSMADFIDKTLRELNLVETS